jgi:hypothetical protein
MGMTCQLHRLSETNARQLLEQPDDAEDFFETALAGSDELHLEKSWHGLHFTLAGSAWGGEGPLGFLLGGQPVAGMDTGYGPPRILLSDQVLDLANALDGITAAEFDRRFDLEQLDAESVYPQIWDEPRPDLLDEYLSYFEEMKEFVRQAATLRQAVMIVLN